MFIRQIITVNKKTGVQYTKHCLVESYRTDVGVRQRVVMHLGELSVPKSEWPKLASVLEARLAGQETLFEDKPELANVATDILEHAQFVKTRKKEQDTRESNQQLLVIDLNSLATSESRSLGPELVAHSMWERLGCKQILESCGLSTTETALAEAVVVGRLVAPDTELATWRWLKTRTALLELLPIDLQNIGKDAIYEISDLLLERKEKIEQALFNQEAMLFPERPLLFLYDLTNTYFEGRCADNGLAQYGKSKEKRTDCPLVTLALLVDSHGFPVFSQIYEGNQSEPETLETVLRRLSGDTLPLFPELRPTIVMDRGIATKKNLDLLKDQAYQYIVIERRPVEKEYLHEFEHAKEQFEQFQATDIENVYLKKLPIDNGTRVLCLSEGRQRKEIAIDTLKEKRFIEELERLKKSIHKGNIVIDTKIWERIGRLKQKYASIARYYELNLQLDDLQKKAVDLVWDKKPIRNERNTLTGCYVIETTHEHLSSNQIWKLYMTLSHVEAAFRDLKTDLGLRPVYHQLAERTKGHLFISVLAYHLLISIEETLRKNDDNRRWSTINEQLSTHQRTTVIMTDDQKQIHHCRVSGTPESVHQEIYRLLDVKDPLKRINKIVGTRL
ncbi:MAG TPA: IS1634 family transposase [Cytophagales bacterium]|jgi:transposase|nr:IS1634 family transposase [Cytophagales bacterium]